MKIEHIQADNFLRLNLFDISLTGATLHLFAGNNEAGKTSVQEAVRFALLGETVRVKNKGDYKLMIRDGAKTGTAAVRVDGKDLVRDIKTAKMQTDSMTEYAAQLPEYLPYLLNSQYFARVKMADRRAFLIGLTGTKVGTDDIARRMKAKGVHEKCINQVIPMVRSSMDAAHGEAATRAAEARAQWVGLTGQSRYGSQIAAGWKPTVPEGYDPKTLLANEKGLMLIREAIDTLNVKKGGLVAKIAEATNDLGKQTGGGEVFDKKLLTKMLKGIVATKAKLKAKEDRRKILSDEISNAKERVPVPCCECGAMLRVSFRGKGVEVEPYVPMSEKALEAAQGEILNTGCDITDLTTKLKTLNEEAIRLQRLEALSAGSGKKVTQEDIDSDRDTLKALDVTLIDLNQKHADLDEKMASLRTAAEQIRNAAQTEERAQSLHRAVQAWAKCVEVLAPDGIPAEILSDTLKPVNDRLRSTASLTGWAQVTISPTMDVVVDNRPYNLLSESAKWRADAAIADAIAHLSGLQLLILDRMDVLDIPSRGALMGWMSKILDEYETILLFGTLKGLPSLPEGMAAHWIENGEVKEVCHLNPNEE
jgi:hypothetical protein